MVKALRNHIIGFIGLLIVTPILNLNAGNLLALTEEESTGLDLSRRASAGVFMYAYDIICALP